MSPNETGNEKTEHQIRLLIDKYADGTMNDVEASVLAEWIRRNPQNAIEFKRHLRSIKRTGKTTVQAVAFWHRFADRNLKRSPRRFIYGGIAAAVAILLGGTIAMRHYDLERKVDDLTSYSVSGVASEAADDIAGESIVIYRTAVNEMKTVVLPDSTKVILNSDTELTLAGDFNKAERRVELDGEAFFDVVSDPSRKFIVTCGNNEYTVRGTSFNIISYSTDSYSVVTLHTGRLDAQIRENVLVLKPGDELRVDESVNTIAKHVVNTSNSTSWIQDGPLVFSEMPLKFVANRIAHKYNVKINVHSSVENILYAGQIDKESLRDALNLLSITAQTPLSVTEFDGEYYISMRTSKINEN